MNKFKKLKQDYLIALKEASRINVERCNFNDECDICNDPKLGSFAYGGSQYEVDGYMCGKCVLKTRKKIDRNKTSCTLQG